MPRTRVKAQERQFIAERARGRCEYCRSPVNFAIQSFSVEHIIPLSRGGKAVRDNLALACPGWM
jgi:5-methylcytosine-specific restriction endonuclease McrA